MTITSLIIDGTPKDSTASCRFLIWINGEKIWLTCKAFSYLAKLAVARRIGEGWLHKTEIEPGENHGRYMYRMKKETGNLIEVQTNWHGSYMIDVDPRCIFFNHKAMADFPDEPVREAVELVEEPA